MSSRFTCIAWSGAEIVEDGEDAGITGLAVGMIVGAIVGVRLARIACTDTDAGFREHASVGGDESRSARMLSSHRATGFVASPASRLTRDTLLRAVAELSRSDSDLATSVQRFGTPPLWLFRPGFATLVRIILGQQVSQASANAAYARLVAGLGRVTAARVAASSQQRLQTLGLTRQKADYCLDLSRRVVARELDLRAIEHADDPLARHTLLGIRGVGPWSADIYLLMALGRPDVWPHGDLALAIAAQQIKRLRARPTEQRLHRLASAWRPWRSVAARILWHHYLSERRPRRRNGQST